MAGWEPLTLAHGGPPPPLRPAPPRLQAAEKAAWAALRALRCAPWFDAYAALRRARFGEVETTAHDPGRAPRYAAAGMLLSEHAGGVYMKQWSWSFRLGWHRAGT